MDPAQRSKRQRVGDTSATTGRDRHYWRQEGRGARQVRQFLRIFENNNLLLLTPNCRELESLYFNINSPTPNSWGKIKLGY